MRHPYIQYSTASTGTVTCDDTGDDLTLIQEAVLAVTLTIALPATPRDGQILTIASIGGVTTLTMTTPVGTIVSGLSTIAVGGTSRWTYRGSTLKWYKIG